MIAIVQPSRIEGSIRAPRSKSDMQRACAAALLHHGTTHIVDPGGSNDDQAALDVIAKLGALVTIHDHGVRVESHGVAPRSGEINCGESGLGIRMFTPIAALANHALTIRGTGSLTKRPMDFFDQIFPQLGIEISSNEGRLPLKIKGPMKPATIEVDGSLSSQFLTGLLMAYSAAGASGVVIKVKDLKSKPYIDLTLSVLKSFGMKLPVVSNHEDFSFIAAAHIQPVGELTYHVEGDWSGAAFLFVAAAIAGKVRIGGMNKDSVQADIKILEAIKDAGASLQCEDGIYHVGPAELKAFHFDATECPDLFPPLVALAAYCKGTTTIKGAKRLTHKESNRALTLQEVFGEMGVVVLLDDDMMMVLGGGPIKGARVHSHHDHRIAMAAAVASLGAEAAVTIDEAEAIDKSYPDFYKHLQSLGVNIQLQTV